MIKTKEAWLSKSKAPRLQQSHLLFWRNQYLYSNWRWAPSEHMTSSVFVWFFFLSGSACNSKFTEEATCIDWADDNTGVRLVGLAGTWMRCSVSCGTMSHVKQVFCALLLIWAQYELRRLHHPDPDFAKTTLVYLDRFTLQLRCDGGWFPNYISIAIFPSYISPEWHDIAEPV